MIYDVR